MALGEKVAQLACHETHQFHDQCYENFITHNANNPNLKLCPLCRVKIDEGRVIKKVYHAPKASEMTAADAFGLDSDAKKMNDADTIENDALKDLEPPANNNAAENQQTHAQLINAAPEG